MNRPLAIAAAVIATVSSWSLLASADPLPPQAEVFDDAPASQGPSISVETTCDETTVFFHGADGLQLFAAVDAGDIASGLLPAGQTAVVFDGWHDNWQAQIVDVEALEPIVAEGFGINATVCVDTRDTTEPTVAETSVP